MTNRHIPPPPPAERLAAWALDDQERDTRLGDLEELFRYFVQVHGASRARAWYRRQVLLLVILALVNNTKWSCIMFKNYLKSSFRNIRRSKGYSFINISVWAWAWPVAS